MCCVWLRPNLLPHSTLQLDTTLHAPSTLPSLAHSTLCPDTTLHPPSTLDHRHRVCLPLLREAPAPPFASYYSSDAHQESNNDDDDSAPSAARIERVHFVAHLGGSIFTKSSNFILIQLKKITAESSERVRRVHDIYTDEAWKYMMLFKIFRNNVANLCSFISLSKDDHYNHKASDKLASWAWMLFYSSSNQYDS